MHEGERDWVRRVVENLSDDQLKLAYADWLAERGDKRSEFLRQFVAAAKSMNAGDFPSEDQQPVEWLELIGYRLLSSIARHGAIELKKPLLRLARPALRMKTIKKNDCEVAVATSKLGGEPDLPPDAHWPLGADCAAIYNDDTAGVKELAGFLAQINLADISHTQAGRLLPDIGVLSFFCFQDIENDRPDTVGVRAMLFQKPAALVRTVPPGELIEGNKTMDSYELAFEETLDLPETFDGPWSDEFPAELSDHGRELMTELRRLNFKNVLGYARATSGRDPTPNRQTRHLILLENSVGCRMHIQIGETDLAARNFDAIKLAWVDFD